MIFTLSGVTPSSNPIYTVPSAYRPSFTARSVALSTDSENVSRLVVNTSGEVSLAQPTSATAPYFGQIVWDI